MRDPLETILQQCAEAAPEPWYPSGYAQANGVKRDDLDPHLDQLRMAGLIQLTDWVQGQGQGYALTPAGKRVLQSPRELARIRAGKFDRSRYLDSEPPSAANRRLTAFERGEEIRAAFLHSSPAVVSYLLIFVNIIWFIWGLTIALQHGNKLNQFFYASTEEVLRRTGALNGEYLLESPWGWGRLITCCFVHIGLLHLGVNMYSLWAVGPFFEQLWGRRRFLVLYLLAGLGGSCAMVIRNPLTMGAGASGALWGILAAHAVWIMLNRRYLPGPLAAQMLRQVIIVLVINIGITFGVPNISAAAHFGGGVVGAITALLLNYQRFGGPVPRRLSLLGLIALPVICLGSVAVAERIDPRWQVLQLQELYRQPVDEASRSLRTTVAPFQGQPFRVLSIQEVKEAVGGLGQARAEFYQALERLRGMGPYPNATVEQRRQQVIRELATKVAVYERQELREFILPLIADANRRARQVYAEQEAKFDPLDNHQRTQDAIEELLAPCRKVRSQLESAIELLRQTKPYLTPEIEKERETELAVEEARLELWKDTEQRWQDKLKQ
jgi:membrane associated rhomboid family serine protease